MCAMYRSTLLQGLVLFLLLSVLNSPASAVTSKVYVTIESPKLFADAAQAEDATWTLTGLISGAGRISARLDLGTTTHAAFYRVRCHFQLTGTNIPGDTLEIYAATSDGTNPDGELGTTDGALATAKRNNLVWIGNLVVDQATTDTTMTASWTVMLLDRYVQLGIWNASTLPLRASTAVHGCTLTPAPLEQQ
jgi:hypothetical protein